MTADEAIELVESHWPANAIKDLDPRDYIEVAEAIQAASDE
jgi:hypothetical protein